MTPLILAVDSGLDGAFVWMRDGKVLHHVLTRHIVDNSRIDMRDLVNQHLTAMRAFTGRAPATAYLEEPFQSKKEGQNNTSGYTDQCKRWGRLQGWLESWGYEVKGVQAKTWQRELLDLARFEVRTEKECKPRLAEGWALKKSRAFNIGYVLARQGKEVYRFGIGPSQEWCVARIASLYPEAILTTKTVLSHDTKAASIAYAREHFPGVELVPPRCKNPHDGLADALCIAAWATKQLDKETQ